MPVYEKFVEGAKEGFTTAIRILPYLVAILFSIAMFRASGAMTALQETLRTPLAWVGMPPEVLPMAIVRPLTGSDVGVPAAVKAAATLGSTPYGLVGSPLRCSSKC